MPDPNPIRTKFDPTNFIPPPADAPVVLDMTKCLTLIRTASAYYRHPGGDRLKDVVEQLKLLMDEYGKSAEKINAAQADAVRFQRDAQGANSELGRTSGELIEARKVIEALRGEVDNLRTEVSRLSRPVEPSPAQTAEKPKRGKKGKIVPMEHERKAGA